MRLTYQPQLLLRWVLFSLVIVVIAGRDSFQLIKAQSLNPSIPQNPSSEPLSPTPTPLSPPTELLQPPPPALSPPEEFPTDIPGTIVVKRFKFEGNTAFSEEELAKVTEIYTNRLISFAQLLQARSAVTQKYVDAGYVTSGAYIPPQAIDNGVVTIKIIEGSLEAINVTVEGKLTPDYVRRRLAIAGAAPLNVNRLLEGLQLLQIDPLIETISAELSASPTPGQNILTVTVVPAPSFDLQVVLDNGRNPQVGSFRRGVEVSDANFIGFGDKIRGSYRNTDGSNDLEFSYKVPVNPRNGTVELGLRNLTGRVIEPPFDVLDLASDYQKYELKYRQPIVQTLNTELALGLSLDYQASFTRTPFFPVTPPGADSSGRTRVAAIRFFQEWTQRNAQQVIAARSELNLGVDALGTTTPFDADFNPDAPNPQAFFWRGQAQWVRLLAPETLFVVRSDLQLADSVLVPLEQFALGGLGSVEGYRQNVLLTDNGFFATMELRIPLYRLPQQDAVLHLIPFVDFGMGWNNGDFTPAINTLASVGMGLQWRYSDHFNARIDVGIPLGRVPFEGNTWQDRGIVFTVIMSP